MNNRNELKNWAQEQSQGDDPLIDVKFCANEEFKEPFNETTLEAAARIALILLRGTNDEIDITDEDL